MGWEIGENQDCDADPIDYRLVAAGTNLPDLIDKPLGIYLLGRQLGSGRIYGHTLLFGLSLVDLPLDLGHALVPELIVGSGLPCWRAAEDVDGAGIRDGPVVFPGHSDGEVVFAIAIYCAACVQAERCSCYSARLDIFEPGAFIDGQDLVTLLPFLFRVCESP